MEVDQGQAISLPNGGIQQQGISDYTQTVNEVLEQLSKIPELRVKSQQRTEEELSSEDKLDAVRKVLEKSTFQFLTMFGKYLRKDDLKHFETNGEEDVQMCLKQLRKDIDGARIRTKNRRYAALQKLVDTSDYFTEEEMQRRNPILYDQLIGKFQSKEEKEVFLQRSYQAAASSRTPLADLLMAHMCRNENNESFRRLDQEQQRADEEEAEAEYYSDDEDEEEEDMRERNRRKKERFSGEEEFEEIEDEEKELLKEEFFTTMYQNFLDGKDTDFDYSTVDDNEEYDVGENMEQDEQDKYFDDEDPCEIHSESSNDLESQFCPPVRCAEIESKIKDLIVEGKQEAQDPIDVRMGDDEDELDAYMKNIEQELRKQ